MEGRGIFVNPGIPPNRPIQKLLSSIRTSSAKRNVKRRKYAPLNRNVSKPIGRDIIADAIIAIGRADQKQKDSLITSKTDAYAPMPMKAA
ncbi:MAG: hypothetical protein NTU69_09790 [Proteobacteria bacterium]|nr:hypothetical protein [Pseudomonadota bacterium]